MLRVTRSVVSNTLLIMALILGALAAVRPARVSAAPLAQANEATFRITANSLEGPGQVMAGLVTVTVENTTSEPGAGVFFARLREGKTLADLQAALALGGEAARAAALAILEDSGGYFSASAAGGRARFVITLRQGTHIALADPEKGQIRPLEVIAATGQAMAEPRADVDVTLRDFQIVMPQQLRQGEQTWKVTNVGPQPHEIFYARLLPGKTLQDALAAGPNEPPPIDLTSLAVATPMYAGQMEWIPANLQPGTYVAACFVVDPASGKEHAELGMVTQFSVAAPGQPAAPPAAPPALPSTGEAPIPAELPNTGAGDASSIMLLVGALFLFGFGMTLRRRRHA